MPLGGRTVGGRELIRGRLIQPLSIERQISIY